MAPPLPAPVCQRARGAWLAAALGDESAAVDAATARHVAACPVCQERLDQLGAAVLGGDPDAISCAEARRRLPAYVDGIPADALLIHHLATCPECAAESALAGAALAELRAGNLDEPPHEPSIDLDFLEGGQTDRAADGSRRRWLQPWPAWRRAAAAAALVLLALTLCAGGAWWLGASDRSEQDTIPPATLAERQAAESAASPTAGAVASPIGRRRAGRAATAAADARAARAARERMATARALLAGAAATRRIAGTDTAAAATAAALLASATERPAAITTRAAIAPVAPTPSPRPPPPPSSGDDDDERKEPLGDAGDTTGPDFAEICAPRHRTELEHELPAACPGLFPNRSEYDRYRVVVERRGLWSFSTCDGTAIDTILALYPAGAFDPAAPCTGAVAIDDDACRRQSRLLVELEPGAYELLVLEKTGDAPPTYTLRVHSEDDEAACPPRVQATATPNVTPPPVATASATATPASIASVTAPAAALPNATSTAPARRRPR